MFSEICETDFQKFIDYSLNSKCDRQQFLTSTEVPNPAGRRSPAQNTSGVSPPSQVKMKTSPGKKLPKATMFPRCPRTIPMLCQGIGYTICLLVELHFPFPWQWPGNSLKQVTKVANMQLHSHANHIKFLPKVLFVCIYLYCLGRVFVLQLSAVLSSHKYSINCKCSTWHVAVSLQERWHPVYLLTKKTGSRVLINKITCLCHWKQDFHVSCKQQVWKISLKNIYRTWKFLLQLSLPFKLK